ncbi:MAG TPA: hypothetical protein VD701_00445 [Steroidobacteraceae bacterium]|nr:hypothetical protein [Steroidobacteraceae bacterium]
MIQVLRSLIDIALLRRDPGALPASVVLLVTAVVAYAGTSALQSWMLHGGDRLFARTALDLALALALFWVLLAVTRRSHRYRQTVIAVLGTSVIMTPFVVGLLLLQQPALTSYAVKWLAWAGSVAVIVWYTLVVGHILRSALEIGFVTSIAIALTWLIAGDALLRRVFATGT